MVYSDPSLFTEESDSMSETPQSHFEGWAILEIFGHSKYAGYVKTEYFGTACMFRCDVPPLKERETITKSGCYVNQGPDVPGGPDVERWAPPGSKVKEVATIGYTKYFGIGSIFSMSPCEQEAALLAVAEIQPRSIMLISLPKGKTLGPATKVPDEEYDDFESRQL
jgi:hypothetical protein